MISDCIQSILLVLYNLPYKGFCLTGWKNDYIWFCELDFTLQGVFPLSFFFQLLFVTTPKTKLPFQYISNTYINANIIAGVLGRNKETKLYTKMQHHRHTLVSSWLMYVKAGVTIGCQKSEVGNSRDVIFK